MKTMIKIIDRSISLFFVIFRFYETISGSVTGGCERVLRPLDAWLALRVGIAMPGARRENEMKKEKKKKQSKSGEGREKSVSSNGFGQRARCPFSRIRSERYKINYSYYFARGYTCF